MGLQTASVPDHNNWIILWEASTSPMFVSPPGWLILGYGIQNVIIIIFLQLWMSVKRGWYPQDSLSSRNLKNGISSLWIRWVSSILLWCNSRQGLLQFGRFWPFGDWDFSNYVAKVLHLNKANQTLRDTLEQPDGRILICSHTHTYGHTSLKLRGKYHYRSLELYQKSRL